MGGRRIKDLKARMGSECCISKWGARLNSGDIQARGGSHSVISRRSREKASRVRAAESSEFRGE